MIFLKNYGLRALHNPLTSHNTRNLKIFILLSNFFGRSAFTKIIYLCSRHAQHEKHPGCRVPSPGRREVPEPDAVKVACPVFWGRKPRGGLTYPTPWRKKPPARLDLRRGRAGRPFSEIITDNHDNRNNHQKNQNPDCPR